jgi:SAM-dependent methyltransferase
MRLELEGLVRRLLRATSRLVGSDEPVEIEPGVTVRRFVHEWSRGGEDHARRILDRLPSTVALEGRSVLTLRRGAGDLGIEVARRGSRRVVAVEMVPDRLKLARARLEADATGHVVKMRGFAGHLAVLDREQFDLVLAADAFRAYGAPPSSRHVERRVGEMALHLAPGGLLVVVVASPWKSPYGGATDSRIPWVHLVVPERVIFDEFRRARPGNLARTFDDIGVNRITLARYRRAMRESGLELVHETTNVGNGRAMAIARALARVRPLEEYVTQNAYGVWRRSSAR